MGIYSQVESGTKLYRSRFHKSISFSKKYDCRFGEVIPVLAKLVLPGDVWRIGGQALVRYQPMQTPTLTPSYLKVRYFFVPLRLLEVNTELILTGSKNGHLYNGELPEFKNLFTDGNKVSYPKAFQIPKWSFYDYLGCQVGDYESFKTDSCLPAQYWGKGFERIRYDYYDDENIGALHNTFADFDAVWYEYRKTGGNLSTFFVDLPKDYFTSSLPWQLKGTAPVLNVTGNASFQFTPSFNGQWADANLRDESPGDIAANLQNTQGTPPFFIHESEGNTGVSRLNDKINAQLNQSQSITQATITGLGFNADELRTMMAQTRIFERLARCGSRYTEYLRSNFGTAPADDTLQRAQYLGGWKLPIVTTEVLQTGGDSTNPIGTMRGHGITNGGNRINTFFAKEFGLLFGLAHVMPQIEYTQGCPKEFSYKSRFDFFNPSFQHLSEQEVRKGEIYIGSDGENDNTFGFQAYGNELRTSVNMTTGDFRDSLKAWTQSVDYGATRPELNNSFLNSQSYLGNFNKCFAVTSVDSRPILVQFYNDLDVYRPMVKYSTPGLVDHL